MGRVSSKARAAVGVVPTSEREDAAAVSGEFRVQRPVPPPFCGHRLVAPNASGERVAIRRPRPSQAPRRMLVDGRYEVEQRIGEGAMGVVYRCRNLRLSRPMAMKVLRRQFAFDEDLVQRFLNEAAAASAIHSPHVVSVLDCGLLSDGRPYLVMEMLNGKPLTQTLKGPALLSVEAAVRIARQTSRALIAAHEASVIHRDLKPDNLFLCPGDDGQSNVKLLDFGVAKILDESSSRTQTGLLFGTPHYMSPEQACGRAVDARTDIYALGVMLFELLTGSVPFDGPTSREVIELHLQQPVRSVRSVRGQSTRVPESLDRIVRKCMAKDPDQRFQTAEELLAALNQTRVSPALRRIPMKPSQAAG